MPPESAGSSISNMDAFLFLLIILFLDAISELYEEEGIKAKLTVGITPILAEQLNDEHLQNGFIEYLDSRIEKVSKDLDRYPNPKVAHSQHLKYLANIILTGSITLKIHLSTDMKWI